MGVSKKQSTPNFPKNEHFLPPNAHAYVCVSGGKKCSFYGKFDVLCFLETRVSRFAILLYSRRNSIQGMRTSVPEKVEKKVTHVSYQGGLLNGG